MSLLRQAKNRGDHRTEALLCVINLKTWGRQRCTLHSRYLMTWAHEPLGFTLSGSSGSRAPPLLLPPRAVHGSTVGVGQYRIFSVVPVKGMYLGLTASFISVGGRRLPSSFSGSGTGSSHRVSNTHLAVTSDPTMNSGRGASSPPISLELAH